MRFLIFLLISTQAHAITLHEVFCNRIEKEQMARQQIIKKVDKTLKRIVNVIRHDLAEKHINRARFLRYYKNWKHKNQRLKRKSDNYIEYAVTRGCPLI